MSLKSLREAVCGQSLKGLPSDVIIDVINLVRTIDEHRPLGPDGKHGDRHTPTCGCEDKP